MAFLSFLRAGCLCLSEDPALGLKDLGVLPSDLHAVAHGQCADILAGGINAPTLRDIPLHGGDLLFSTWRSSSVTYT